MRKLFLWVGLFSLVASGAQAASYQMIDGTIVDPIQFTYGGDSDYSGIDLEPYANLTNANLKFTDLPYADLWGYRTRGVFGLVSEFGVLAAQFDSRRLHHFSF